jgi:hypothetical protein
MLDGNKPQRRGRRMSISKTVEFVPLVLPAGRLGAAIKAAIEATGLVEPGAFTEVSVGRSLADGSTEDRAHVPLADIDSVCDLSEEGLNVRASAGLGPTWHYIAVFGGMPGRINTSVPTAGVGDQMIQTLMSSAGLALHVAPSEPVRPTAVLATGVAGPQASRVPKLPLRQPSE